MRLLLALIVILCTSVSPVALSAADKNPAIPRTQGGHPDFSGAWTNITLTPLERPVDLAGKEYFSTDEEAAAWAKKMAETRNRDQRTPGTVRDVLNAYNDVWWDSGTKVVKTRRTSIIIDPPDGKIPPLTPEREKELAEKAEAVRLRCSQPGCEPDGGGRPAPADGPEDRSGMERCLTFANAGPPMLSLAYNNNYQVVQSPAFLAIDVEMGHDVRRIVLDGTPHLSANVRQWLGDSRGHWEGDTLIVDTTNFSEKYSFRGSDQNLHLTERFTMVDPDTIIYRFTVEDPTAFTRPWTGEVPMLRFHEHIYEYACNEGNRGLEGILSAARADEKKATKSSGGK